MGFLLAAVTKDLRRMRRDPLALATSLGIPLVLVTLITLVFGGGQATPQGRLLVADEDKSVLSQALSAAFSREPLAKMLVMETTAREEGRRRMDHGDASALLIIPKGFQDAFLQNQPSQLQLVTNPAQEILPKIVEQTLSIVVDGGFYVQRVASVPLRSFITTGQAPDDETIARASVMFSRMGRSLAKYVNPPLIDLDRAPGLLPPNVQGVRVADEQQPHEQHRGKEYGAEPGDTAAAGFVAHVARRGSAGEVGRADGFGSDPDCAFAMIAGSVLFHVHWGPNLPVVVLVLLVYGSLAAALGMLLGNFGRTEGQVIGMGVIASNVFAGLGGCWWPIEITPLWTQRLALAFPTGWTMDALHKLMNFGASPISVLPHLCVTAVAALIAGYVLSRTFRYH